jgi:hypothetical protein
MMLLCGGRKKSLREDDAGVGAGIAAVTGG